MTTTFTSRELARDALAALFVANGSWQEVYHYAPAVEEANGKTPFLTIRSRGTSQDFMNLDTNPASYRFIVTNWVLAYDEAASWGTDDAEDKLDELDKVLRQIIRDNAQNSTWDYLRFGGDYSVVGDIVAEGMPYMFERYTLYADLKAGA